MSAENKIPGKSAIQTRGWFAAYKWLILRRASQFGILGLFMLGPWFGQWIVKGNLSSSLTLGVLPLTDPYLLLQSLLGGHALEKTALIGAAIVIGFYLLVGGRSYCAWVCPVNIVTDAANWLRERLGIRTSMKPSPRTRYWVLGMTLVVSGLTGTLAWEMVNPISMLHRGLIFGMGLAWAVVLMVFLFDLVVAKRGWCSHLCPVGAFYGLLGLKAVLRVKATARERCNDCMECYAVCPEPQVIVPALKGAAKGIGPIIQSSNCTNCGRCVDVCSVDVFGFASRFNNQSGEIGKDKASIVIPPRQTEAA
jgi:ferredoxin-type protein NapH